MEHSQQETGRFPAAPNKGSLAAYSGQGFLRAHVTPLLSFDRRIGGEHEAAVIDTVDKREGAGCLSLTCSGQDDPTVLFSSREAFCVSTAAYRRFVLRLWLYVSDLSRLTCDHEGLYDVSYDHSGTVYFRTYVKNKQGELVPWCVNHTLCGDGWQPVELTFEHDNNGLECTEYDLSTLYGFEVFFWAREGLVVKLDDLQLVGLTNDGYQPRSVGRIGNRLISTGDFDGLYGDVIAEWYGGSFDTKVKLTGSSSYAHHVVGSEDDRAFWGGLNIPLSYQEDVLCFWLYLDDVSNINTLFFDLNQVQDVYDYWFCIPFAQLERYSCTPTHTITPRQWCLIQIPLTELHQKGAGTPYGNGQTLLMHHFRVCVQPKLPVEQGGTPYTAYFDQLFIASRQEAEELKQALPSLFAAE